MIIKKPKVTLKDRQVLLGITLFLLVSSNLRIIIASKLDKPLFAVEGFVCLGLCFFFFTLMCSCSRPLSTADHAILAYSEFFLILFMLALYGFFNASGIGEIALLATLGAFTFIFFAVSFSFFCKFRKENLESSPK